MTLSFYLFAALVFAPRDEPEFADETFVSYHSIESGGSQIDYTATAGTLLMRNADGDAIAQFGYTAYVRKSDQDPARRPILFAYNGGPGSASIWLHMGILGPWRAAARDAGFSDNGPYERVANEFTVLDQADIVMIDPVGTGYSRPVGKGKGEDFWGVDQDAESVAAFIARYTTVNQRWLSPKYILGESYGGMRSGAVAYELLSRHNLALNGVILVSPFMDTAAGRVGGKVDLPYPLFFTTFAATAWYHGVIPQQPDSLRAFLDQAERFAEEVYAPALARGNRVSDEERARVLQGLARFTGVSAEYWDRANLRLSEGQFAKELMRSSGKTIGRIDSRFVGDQINGIGERFTYDPFFPSVGPTFVACFRDYYRRILGVTLDREYVSSGGIGGRWDWDHSVPGGRSSPIANTAVDLAHTMVQNPKMKVLVQQGYYDLATPYGATDYFIDHLDISPDLLQNVVRRYYEAGHMMYLHEPSMEQFKQDLSAFLADTH